MSFADCSKLKQTTRVYAKKIDCLLTSGDSDTSTKSTTVKLKKKNTKPDIVSVTIILFHTVEQCTKEGDILYGQMSLTNICTCTFKD